MTTANNTTNSVNTKTKYILINLFWGAFFFLTGSACGNCFSSVKIKAANQVQNTADAVGDLCLQISFVKSIDASLLLRNE